MSTSEAAQHHRHSAPIASIPDIVSQYAENSACLWNQRELAVSATAYSSTFSGITRLDERLDAQLDGLLTCGEAGGNCAWGALELGGPGEIFTCAVLLSDRGPDSAGAAKQFEDLIQIVQDCRTAVRPVSVALDWVSKTVFTNTSDRLARMRTPLADAVFVMASAMREAECRQQIRRALAHQCEFVRHAACWAALRLDYRDLCPAIENHLLSCDIQAPIPIRVAWMWGSRKATHLLQTLASGPESSQAEIAATNVFRAVDPEIACDLHREMFGGKPTRASVQACSAAGITELLPLLLGWLDAPELARLAADAFSLTTGLDLSRPGMTASGPAVANDPNENPADENVEPDPDELLPWPNSAAIRTWWSSRIRDFRPRTRYLAGAAVSLESLKPLIGTGRQRVRSAAVELAALRGQPWFDVCAPAFMQQQRLARESVWQ